MTILCYHTVDYGWNSTLALEPEAFDAHCSWLARNRQVIDVTQAVERIDGRGRLPSGVAAITFDDGFSSLYEHAWPILRRLSLPAMVFLVAETLTPTGKEIDWARCPPGTRTLTRDEILAMQEDGVTFGSHSYSHRDLTRLGEKECEDDLRASRELLEDVLGRRVPLLAYPFGHHDEKVRRAAQKAGFSHALSLPEGREPTERYAVPRVVVVPGNGILSLRIKASPHYLDMRASPVFPLLRRAARRTGLGFHGSKRSLGTPRST